MSHVTSAIRLIGGPYDGALRRPQLRDEQAASDFVLVHDQRKVRDLALVNRALAHMTDPQGAATAVVASSCAELYRHEGKRHVLRVDDFCFCGTFGLQAVFAPGTGWSLSLVDVLAAPPARPDVFGVALGRVRDLADRCRALLGQADGSEADALRQQVAATVADAEQVAAIGSRAAAGLVAAAHDDDPLLAVCRDDLERAELALAAAVQQAIALTLEGFTLPPR